ncbi:MULTISPECIES: hypothetical protein [unclassified Flavobacterium]|uniref:hypothetical protein n=1 Tax=unclassified Flavobacterium TaxID=196869 RepID=UPI000556BBE9|nr:hypothetical protein [Flavobacterium sp. ASV13]
MSTLNYLRKKISTFKNIKNERNNPPPTNELIHPSFGITETDNKKEVKKEPNSLLFLMYSKENETLFI